jgi:hypothetical protein
LLVVEEEVFLKDHLLYQQDLEVDMVEVVMVLLLVMLPQAVLQLGVVVEEDLEVRQLLFLGNHGCMLVAEDQG